MSLRGIWPNELRPHLDRLTEELKDLILAEVNNTTKDDLDILKRFSIATNQMMEGEGQYKDDPEFLFLVAKICLFEGKNSKVIELSAKTPQHPGLLILKAGALVSMRKFDEVPELLAQAKELSRDSDSYNYLNALSYETLYYNYAQIFEPIPDKISELTEEYQRLDQQFANDDDIRLALLEVFIQGKSVEITLSRRKGELEQGAKIGKELITQGRKTKNRFLLNRLLNNTAICLIEIGNLKEGLEMLEEAFSFSEVFANDLRIAVAANNIGFIYRIMGQLEKAMMYFEKALEKAISAKIAPYIIAAQTNITHSYLHLGKPMLALEKSNLAVKSLKESTVPVPPQIKIALDLCRADIFETLDKFQEVNDTLDLALIEIRQGDLKAEKAKVYLRKARLAGRQANLGEARKFLDETLEISLENNFFESIVNAKLQLAEIDLLRYRMTGQRLLLEEALEKIEDTKQLCLEQDYKIVLVDVYILQGLLLSLNNQQKKGVKVLKEAIELSKEINLPDKETEARNQLTEIKEERQNLLVKIFTRINKSIRATISFESVSRPKSVKTNLKALFIISKTSGLPIYEKSFDRDKKIDASLLSGLLSAIRTMGETILEAREGGLKLIDHGDVAIMLETEKECVFALVLTRETYLMREKLREFSEKYFLESFFKEDESFIIRDERKSKETDKLVEKYFK